MVDKNGDGLGIHFTHTPALTGKLEHWQQEALCTVYLVTGP